MAKKPPPPKKIPPPQSRAAALRKLACQGKDWIVLSEILKKKFSE